MDTVVVSIFAIIGVVLFVAYLFYWIKSLIVLGKMHILLAVVGFIFAPWTQIIYYLAEKNNLSAEEKKVLLRAFVFMIVTPIFAILMVIILPMFIGKKPPATQTTMAIYPSVNVQIPA